MLQYNYYQFPPLVGVQCFTRHHELVLVKAKDLKDSALFRHSMKVIRAQKDLNPLKLVDTDHYGFPRSQVDSSCPVCQFDTLAAHRSRELTLFLFLSYTSFLNTAFPQQYHVCRRHRSPITFQRYMNDVRDVFTLRLEKHFQFLREIEMNTRRRKSPDVK